MIPLSAVSVGKVGPFQGGLVADQVHGRDTDQDKQNADQVRDRDTDLDNLVADRDDRQAAGQKKKAEHDSDIVQRILAFCQVERSKKEICEYMGYRNRTFFTRKYLSSLMENGELRMTQPDKPNSRNQKYIAVHK